jgi:hypothetical protein
MIKCQDLRIYKALSLIKSPQPFITGSYDQMISWLQGQRFVKKKHSLAQPSTVINYNTLRFRSYTKLNKIRKTSIIMITRGYNGKRYGYHSSRPYCHQIRVKTLREIKWKLLKVENPVANNETGHLFNRSRTRFHTINHFDLLLGRLSSIWACELSKFTLNFLSIICQYAEKFEARHFTAFNTTPNAESSLVNNDIESR